jgi:hypothetical protein
MPTCVGHGLDNVCPFDGNIAALSDRSHGSPPYETHTRAAAGRRFLAALKTPVARCPTCP